MASGYLGKRPESILAGTDLDRPEFAVERYLALAGTDKAFSNAGITRDQGWQLPSAIPAAMPVVAAEETDVPREP